MEYSSPISISRGLALASPQHSLIASASGNVLDIYDVGTLTLKHTLPTAAPITQLTWGKDLVAAASSACIVVVNALTGTVVADIHDTPLSWAYISLCGSKLVAVAEHGIAATLFDVERAVQIVTVPFGTEMMSWAPEGGRVVLVTKRGGMEGVCILKDDGQVVGEVWGEIGGITRVGGVKWVKEGILVWGRSTDVLGRQGMCLLDGWGRVVYDGGFEGGSEGISCVGASKKGLVAVGGYDGQIVIGNMTSWSSVVCWGHEAELDDESVVVLRERIGEDEARYFENVEEDEVEVGKGKGKDGVGFVEFSKCGRYLCSRGWRGNVIFIWDVAQIKLKAVLVFEQDVKGVSWGSGLAVVCGNGWVYLWGKGGGGIVRVDGVKGRKVSWADGEVCVVDGVERKAFVIVYVGESVTEMMRKGE